MSKSAASQSAAEPTDLSECIPAIPISGAAGHGEWTKTFKEAFCDRFSCRPEQYDRAALAKLFYPHAWPIALMLEPLNAHCIRGAAAFVQRLGQARSWHDLLNDLHAYQAWLNLHGGICAKGFRIRISGGRVFQMAAQLFGEHC